jgi:hypothetical protein
MMAASAAGSAALGKIIQTREDRESLRHNILREIAALEGRASRTEDEAAVLGLRLRLARTRESVERDSMSDDSAQNIFAELDEISLELHRAETDIKLCRAREGVIFSSLERYVTENVLTPDEHVEIRKEMAEASLMNAGDRLSALSRVAEKLSALKGDKIAEAGNRDARAESPRGRADYDEIRRDIRDFASRISTLDETEGKRAEAIAQKSEAETRFHDKLEDLRRQIKTLWGTVREREALTSFFRDTLGELKDDLANAGKSFESPEGMKLMQRCDAMCGAKYIERTDFMNLYEDLARYTAGREKDIADALFAGKVKEALEELGYEILEDVDGASGADADTLAPGEVRYLESPYDGYRVMAKVDAGGTLTTRLVRVVENDEHTSDSEVCDRAAGAKWCVDFDRFIEKMRQAGLPMDVTLRKEPGEAEIMTIADKAETAASEKRRTRKTHKRRRGSSGMKGEAGGTLEAGSENR